MFKHLRLTFALTAVAVVCVSATNAPQGSLPQPETIAPGIRFYRYDNASHFADGPISARLLEVDSRAASLDLELGKDGVQGRDTVQSMAARRNAVAAVNAGFFATNGDPSGAMKIDGVVVSDTARPRGAVGFATPAGAPLIFGRLAVLPRIRLGGKAVAITGVDTARGPKDAVLYTSRYGADTKTTGAGHELAFDGNLRLLGGRVDKSSPIPANGFVLSVAAGHSFNAGAVRPSDRLQISFDYRSERGARPQDWQRADDIVGGAGLLLLGKSPIADWAAERLDLKGFVDQRHPRTLIGRDGEGDTWLVVVDGRQPAHSVGMSLPELTAFVSRLGIIDALNLDGGGSSTMVVKGQIVNRPSDAIGPRPVSDSIVVFSGRSNTRRD